MAKKQDLKIALLLDLDNFAPGLKKARATATAEGSAINAALSDVANKVAGRFFSVQAALGLAKKGFKEFVDAAERLEKRGQGNEGTAAIARISAAVGRMQENFVKAVMQTDLMRGAVGFLADAAEVGAVALRSWGNASDVATAGVRALGAETLDFLAKTAGQATAFGASVRAALNGLSSILPGSSLLGVAASGVAGANIGTGGQGSAVLTEQADRLRSAAADAQGRIRSEIEKMRAEQAKDSAKSRAESYSRAGGSVVDAFVSSWEGGFARLSSYFHDFSKEVSSSLGFLKDSTASALGDTFDSVSMLGPMLQRVYGQSAEGAKRFQAAQLALAGALAVVKGAMAVAEASDLLTEDPAGAAAKLVAAAGYAAAAGLAGVATTQTLSAGGRSPAAGGIASPGQFGQDRRTVTLVVENLVGSEDFVRREVIPEINRAVRGSVTVLSTAAQAANSLQPGRDF